MSCNPTRILLSNSGATTMNVTVSPDPGDGVSVTFQVDGLTISDSEPTSGGTAVFSIATVVAVNNSLWDATLQIGSNTPVEAEVQVVESNGSQTIGVTLTDSEVTYCSPTSAGGGGTGTVTGVTGVTPISVTASATTPEVSLDDDGITTAKIADDAVTSPKIADDAVTHGKIADLAVEHGKIGLGAVQTTNIDDDAVTADKLADTAVTPGSYTTADITVDAQGRITSASTGSPPAGTVTSVTAGSGLTGGTITSTGTIAHGPGTFVGSEEYPVKIVVDSFGHIQVNESETTAGAYRTAVGADDASNLTTGTLPAARLPNTSVTAGSYTSADITVDAQGRLTAASSGSGGGGGTDYTAAPITQTWRYFDDCYAATIGASAGIDQFWAISGANSVSTASASVSGARGVISHSVNASYDRYTYWLADMLSGVTEADGDELIVEARLYLEDNTATAGTMVVGVVDRTNGPSHNAQPPNTGYQASDYACVCVDLARTNLVTVVKDTGGSGSPTVTDLGSSYPLSSYVDTWVRLGVHAKYNATDSDWDMTYYINGVSVGTASMTFTTELIPYVGIGVGGGGSAMTMYTDWVSYQGNIGSPISGRLTRIDIGDI